MKLGYKEAALGALLAFGSEPEASRHDEAISPLTDSVQSAVLHATEDAPVTVELSQEKPTDVGIPVPHANVSAQRVVEGSTDVPTFSDRVAHPVQDASLKERMVKLPNPADVPTFSDRVAHPVQDASLKERMVKPSGTTVDVPVVHDKRAREAD